MDNLDSTRSYQCLQTEVNYVCIFVNSFTGGDTGIAISRKAGMIPLQMELGGKDTCLVLEDADLELAANNIIKGGYSYRY